MTFSQAQASITAAQSALAQFCSQADPSPAHQPGAALTGTAAGLASVAQICAAAATSIGAIQASSADPVGQATGIWNAAAGQALAALQPVTVVWLPFLAAAQQVAFGPYLNSVALPTAGIVAELRGFQSSLQGLNTPLTPPLALLPPFVTTWLGQTVTTMHGFAVSANTAAAYLGPADAGSQLTAAIGAAQQTLSGLLAGATAIQAAVSGGSPPADAGTLSRYLDGLAQLRVSAWPTPVTAAQRSAYQADTASYATVAEELLATSTGLPTSCPAALLPVRLETRLQTSAGGAGYTLKVRIFPDDVAIDSHDPTLTALEVTWAAHLQQAVAARAVAPATAAATWAQVAAMFGAPRTAYLNAVDLNDHTLVPAPGTPGRSLWTRRATTALLPDRWLAVAYGSDAQLLAAGLSSPVTSPLAVGPDPQAATAATGPAGVPVDPALAWLVDFDAASSAGMALTLSLDGGAAGSPPPGQAAGPPTVGKLIVVGLQTPTTPDPAAALAGVLTAHRFTTGLEILAPGTPTNNTSAGPSGYSSTDPAFADSYAREVTIPDGWTPARAVSGDAARLIAALGMAAGTLVATGNIREDALAAQAMAALTWRASWATYLPWLGMPPTVLDEVRGWASAWVKPGGPLPTLRIGQQVYGVQPAVALNAFADAAPVPAFIAVMLRQLQPSWLTAAGMVLGDDLNTQLARSPVSSDIRARAGIAGVSGWMDDSHGIMGTPWTGLSGQTSLMPRALAAGRFWGGPPTAWPADFLLYPVPSDAPWPVAGGGLPLVPEDPRALTAFLAGLPAGSRTPPSPGSLLAELAGYAWVHTSGVPGTPPPAFTGRGLLSAGTPEPALPTEANELSAATAWLAARPDLDFAGLLGGTIDVTTHRLDAWATALATYRLGQLRQQPAANAPPLLIGAFGWLENLVGQPALPGAGLADDPDVLFDKANAGFVHAPSVAQATTAAVLRSGYLTHNPPGQAVQQGQPAPGNASFAIDLSSRRARRATWLLDGVRAGQPLGALLGYQFERELVESGHGALIAQFRAIAPADPAANQDVSATPPAAAAAVRATDVTDGVTLYQMWQHQPAPSPGNGSIWALASPALANLADSFDAVADAVTAGTLHQMLAGNPSAAAATMAAVASGTVTADASAFLDTPRTGTSVIHRILLTVPAAPGAAPPGWTGTPRTRAEPALSAWLARLLPAPASTSATVTLTDSAGAPLAGVAPVPVTLAQLGIGPLDLLDLAGRPAELAQLAAHTAITARAGATPPAAGGILSATQAPAGTPFALVLDIAGRLAAALSASRPADGRDLAPPGASTDPGADQGELAARLTGALADLDAALKKFAQAFPAAAVPPPGSSAAPPAMLPVTAGAAAFTSALLSAVGLGVPGAAPANTGADATALQALAGQAYSAWAELTRRKAAATAAAATTGSTPAQQLAAGLAQLEAVFGPTFPATAQLTNAGQILTAASLQVTQAPRGQEPLAWLVKAARIRPTLAALYDALTAAEALGSGPALSMRIAQLPTVAGASWAGLPVTGTPPASGTLCLEMLGGALPPTGPAAALVVADWAEAIPSARETTAITYHYDAPATQAPNAILLAVPANRAVSTWTYASLRDTVGDTLNLARIRTVDYLDLPALGVEAWAVPAPYLADTPFSTAAVTVDTGPETFLQRTPVATVTGCAPSGPPLMQGQAGQLQITGSDLSGLAPSQFIFSPAGITPSTWTSSSDSTGLLTVTVAAGAPAANYSIRAGAGPTLPNAVTVRPRPQAVSCGTSVINQHMTPFTATITVFGQTLQSATARLTTSAGTSISLSSPTPTVSPDGTAASWTLPVAASDYDPSPDVIDMPGRIVRIPPPRPRNVPVPLTLTVTLTAPGAAGTASFPITLNTIV